MSRPTPWCLSFTGKRIEYNSLVDHETLPLCDLIKTINPVDICAGLSTKYRFTGFTKVPWSVLSHTVIGTALILDQFYPNQTFEDLTSLRSEVGYQIAEAYFTHDFSEYLVPDFNNLLKPSLQMVTGDIASDAETVVTWRSWEQQVQERIVASLYYPGLRSAWVDNPIKAMAHTIDMSMARLEAQILHCFSPEDIARGCFAEVDPRTQAAFADYVYRAVTANRRLYVPHYSSADPGRLQYRDGLTPIEPSSIGASDTMRLAMGRDYSPRVTLPPFDSWRHPFDIDGLYGPWHVHHPQFLFWSFLRLFVPDSWYWGTDEGKPVARFLSRFDDCCPSLRNLCTLGL